MTGTTLTAKDWQQSVNICESNIKEAKMSLEMFTLQLEYAKTRLKAAERRELTPKKKDDTDTSGSP